MWKMKRSVSLFFNRFETPIRNAFSKRPLSNQSIDSSLATAKAMDGDANKIGLLEELFLNPRFLSGVAVGGFAATVLFAQPQSVEKQVEIDQGVSIEKDKLKFEDWMRKHKRVYKDEKEKEERFSVFQSKLRYIEAHDRDKTKTFTVGLNSRSDWTKDEWHQYHRRSMPSLPIVSELMLAGQEVSREVASKP